MRWPISRVLSRTIIHLGQTSPFASSNLPKNATGRTCLPSKLFFYLVLLQVGFTVPQLLPVARCALTAPFHPYRMPSKMIRRFTFCCTSRRLTPPRRYLAPCPVEPGLSSTMRSAQRDCLAISNQDHT